MDISLHCYHRYRKCIGTVAITRLQQYHLSKDSLPFFLCHNTPGKIKEMSEHWYGPPDVCQIQIARCVGYSVAMIHAHFLRNTLINLIMKLWKIKAERPALETEKMQPTDTFLSVLSPHSGQNCVRTCHCGVMDLNILISRISVLKWRKRRIRGVDFQWSSHHQVRFSFPLWPTLFCFSSYSKTNLINMHKL